MFNFGMNRAPKAEKEVPLEKTSEEKEVSLEKMPIKILSKEDLEAANLKFERLDNVSATVAQKVREALGEANDFFGAEELSFFIKHPEAIPEELKTNKNIVFVNTLKKRFIDYSHTGPNKTPIFTDEEEADIVYYDKASKKFTSSYYSNEKKWGDGSDYLFPIKAKTSETQKN